MPKNNPKKADEADSPQTEPSAAEPNAAADEMAAEVVDMALGEPDEEIETPRIETLESLRDQLKLAEDRLLRGRAELENYRKRATRELQDQARYANLPLLRDTLPALDNLNRAIEAAEKTHDTASLLEGVKMVAKQIEAVLSKHHCVEIAAINEPFDPHLHEAILQQPSSEHPVSTVMQVTQAGFQLHDRVVRPSQVIVSAEVPGDEVRG